jgi:hypothetical protein
MLWLPGKARSPGPLLSSPASPRPSRPPELELRLRRSKWMTQRSRRVEVPEGLLGPSSGGTGMVEGNISGLKIGQKSDGNLKKVDGKCQRTPGVFIEGKRMKESQVSGWKGYYWVRERMD